VAHELECINGVAVRPCAPTIESAQNTEGELNQEFASFEQEKREMLLKI